jgi:DNA polymerase-3 subunit delta'
VAPYAHFDQIKGQDTVIAQLRRSVLEKRIGHALLFAGPPGVGKGTTAQVLAAALNCLQPWEGNPCGQCASCRLMISGNHPNLYRLLPGERSIKIEQIRQLQQTLSYKRWGSGYKVAILEGAEALTLSAANSMLKILEEPPSATCFILVTDNVSALLPTIVSRCQKLLFHQLSQSVLQELLREHGLEPERANCWLV